MANRWPIASGNWSDSAIWSGSLIPTASDDVYANNRIVTIDQNITVTSLRNSAITGVTAGGSFIIIDNYIVSASTIISNIINSGLIYSGSSGCTINGNIQPGGSSNFVTSVLLSGSGGTINISGSLINTAGSGNQYNIGILTSNQTINFTGSIANTSTDSRNRIFNIAAGPNTYNILSNITSSGGNVFTCNSNIVNINITGSTLTNANITPIINAPGATSTINITGSIIGPFLSTTALHTTTIQGRIATNSTTTCISDTSIGSISISGSVIATSSSVITCTGAGILTIYGPISSSISANGVASTSTTAINLFTAPFYNTGSFNAVYAYRMQMIEPTSTTWRFDTEVSGGSKTLYTANQLPGVPRQNNVRKGTQYNFGLTGSLEMPDPTTVKSGVAVDNTTGSAILTPQDMFDVLTQDITQTGSIGKTLDNVSTVQTVAATVSAFKV